MLVILGQSHSAWNSVSFVSVWSVLRHHSQKGGFGECFLCWLLNCVFRGEGPSTNGPSPRPKSSDLQILVNFLSLSLQMNVGSLYIIVGSLYINVGSLYINVGSSLWDHCISMWDHCISLWDHCISTWLYINVGLLYINMGSLYINVGSLYINLNGKKVSYCNNSFPSPL